MWTYVLRRILYNVPVYLGIVMLMMAFLRVQDPVWTRLGKNATDAQYEAFKEKHGLDEPFLVQYVNLLGDVATGDFTAQSWDHGGLTVGQLLGKAVVPSVMITLPALILSTLISITVALVSAFYRGRAPDRILVVLAVLGMSVSFLVYIIFGQYFGGYLLKDWVGHEVFAISGYEHEMTLARWVHYCLLPVMISVIVTMGYDTRYYRAVMVEESGRDYITTAKAKGAGKRKIMFVHMLKNAMIPIITRVMITLPFLFLGSLLLEVYFQIPGMGFTLLAAITGSDFPVVQAFVTVFAAFFILSNILTDVLYALVDPRVRLS